MVKKIDEFPKRNEMVMLKGNTLSVYASKTLDYIYKEGLSVYENKRDGGIFEINIYDLKKEIGMNVQGSKHDKIIKELKAINELSFETYDNKHYSSFPILAGFKLNKTGILEVALSPFLIREMMFNENNVYYHMTNLVEFKELKSKYSKRILDLHKRYHGSTPKFELEKFQGLMQYPENYRNGDIKLRVLEQAQKELKEKNNMVLRWDIEKIGAKWKNIKLSIQELGEIQEGTVEFSNSLLLVLAKARKNRFIDEKYSRKAMEKIVSQYDEQDIIKALREAYKYNSEILNFSKFLISKIEDVVKVKNEKLKIAKLKKEEAKKLKAKEKEEKQEASELNKKKAEIIQCLIRKKKTNLFGELGKQETLEELKEFIEKNQIDYKIKT